MFDESGLMEAFSVTQTPKTLHITCYLPMTERCAAIHSLFLMYFSWCAACRGWHKRTFFSLLNGDTSLSCLVIMCHWWAHDMEWIKPSCRNTYILSGSFLSVLGCLPLGYAWLHRWQCGLAVKARQAELQGKPNWNPLLCETEEMEL